MGSRQKHVALVLAREKKPAGPWRRPNENRESNDGAADQMLLGGRDRQGLP